MKRYLPTLFSTICLISMASPTIGQDTIPPQPPRGLKGTLVGQALILDWDASEDSDVVSYRVDQVDLENYTFKRGICLSSETHCIVGQVSGWPSVFWVSALDQAGNESRSVGPIRAVAPILLVNGYFDSYNPRYVGAYQSALEKQGYAYGKWSIPEQGNLSESVLATYREGLVIWSIGYFHPFYPNQFNAAQQSALVNYLVSGGNLIFSGAFAALHLDQTPLFVEHMPVKHVSHHVNLPQLNGVVGTPWQDAHVNVTMGYLGYLSEIDPVPPAMQAIDYDLLSGQCQLQSSGTAIATVDGDNRIVYLGFPFADIEDEYRAGLLERMIDWVFGMPMAGDLDRDGDVDLDDWADFASCVSGVGNLNLCGGPVDSADFDWDGDVDLRDFAEWQRFIID